MTTQEALSAISIDELNEITGMDSERVRMRAMRLRREAGGVSSTADMLDELLLRCYRLARPRAHLKPVDG